MFPIKPMNSNEIAILGLNRLLIKHENEYMFYSVVNKVPETIDTENILLESIFHLN